jgi:PadR family transcriptional regulator, regulatory protein PadR
MPGSLTEPAFFVLAALLDQPRHGYGLIGEVEALSEGRVRLRVGTLYGVLDRLVAEGSVEPDREEVHSGRVRRYYRLTGEGRTALEAEVARQESNARAARARLTVRPA